jgi:hypothetical protein
MCAIQKKVRNSLLTHLYNKNWRIKYCFGIPKSSNRAHQGGTNEQQQNTTRCQWTLGVKEVCKMPMRTKGQKGTWGVNTQWDVTSRC